MKLFTIFLTILTFTLISLTSISAETIIAGTNYTFSIETNEIVYYIVIGNSSNMEGLSVYQDIYEIYSNITIETVLNYQPDNFTMVFFSNITNEVIVEVRVDSGGGSGSVFYVYKNVTSPGQTIYLPSLLNNTIDTNLYDDLLDKYTDLNKTFFDHKRLNLPINYNYKTIILFCVGGLVLFFLIKFFLKRLKGGKLKNNEN